MMRTYSLGDGAMPDVVMRADGSWLVAYAEMGQPNRLIVQRSQQLGDVWQAQPLASGAGFAKWSYPWLAFNDGLHDTGRVWNLETGVSWSVGPINGGDAIDVTATHVYWIATPSMRLKRQAIDGSGQPEDLGPWSGGAQGISQIDADGTVHSVDAISGQEPGMVKWASAGSLIAGERDKGRDGIVVRLNGLERVLWPLQASNTPRCDVAGGHCIVATWGPGAGVRVAVFDSLIEIPVVPDPVPVPDPPPVPNPLPDPEPPMPDIRQTSSLDPAYLHAAVAASWLGTHGTEIPPGDAAYWYEKASTPAQYSDGVWRIGWNRYWETRQGPDNQGSADPALGDQPAVYPPAVAPPAGPPVPQPDPPPVVVPPPAPVDLAPVLARLDAVQAALVVLGQSVMQQSAEIAALKVQTQALAARKLSGTIFGMPFTLQ